VSFDGVAAGGAERVLVMAATNLPWDIDSAAMRRLPKRVYVPMPNEFARHDLIRLMLNKGKAEGTDNDITPEQIDQIVSFTDGYSNSDLASLVREAAAEPMREAMQVISHCVQCASVRANRRTLISRALDGHDVAMMTMMMTIILMQPAQIHNRQMVLP
jgi:SpoVK/Ycf46/Vps4 family AAA+-type ATPase